MFKTLIHKIVGTKNERELKRLQPRVDTINGFEAQLQGLSDDDLRAKTAAFKERVTGAGNDDLAAVIISSCARYVSNPTGMLSETVGAFSVRYGVFNGWTLPELATSAFRVRIIDVSSLTTKTFSLDYVGVQVSYTP